MKKVTMICLVLALAAAAFYVLMGMGVLAVAGLEKGSDISVIAYAAGGCYLVGGLLILTGKRWLLTTGLAINALVIAFFFVMYSQKPDVMLSVPGLGTKIAQILLEFGLAYLAFGEQGRTVAAERI